MTEPFDKGNELHVRRLANALGMTDFVIELAGGRVMFEFLTSEGERHALAAPIAPDRDGTTERRMITVLAAETMLSLVACGRIS